MRLLAYQVPTFVSTQVSGFSEGPAVTIGAAELTVTKQRTEATKLEMTIERMSCEKAVERVILGQVSL